MRQEFFLEDVECHSLTLCPGSNFSVMPTTDKVQSGISVLHCECFLNTRPEQFEQIGIILVETDMRENISVGDDTQSTENNDDRNGNLDVG